MNEKHSFPFSPELLAQTPPEVLAYFLDRLEQAEKIIAQLEERLALTSKNSNLPPSSDSPGQKTKSKPKSERKRGGQPGHKGHKRELLPPEQVDSIISVKPENCRQCGLSFDAIQSSNPERHQVTELPVIRPIVTEYQLHHLTCPNCQTNNHAKKPKGVPEGMFGPRLMSMVALSSGSYQLSKRQITQLLRDFFGVTLSLGTVSRIEKRVSNALRHPVEEVERFLPHQEVVHIDETGMKQEKKKGWMWTFVTKEVSLFRLSRSRGSEIPKEVLGEGFSGLGYTDRWGAYNWLAPTNRQFCWAHLIRDFERLKLRGKRDEKLANRLLHCSKRLFKWLRKVRDGTLSIDKLEQKVRPLRAEVLSHLREGKRCVQTKRKARTCRCEELNQSCLSQETAKFCRSLVKNEESLFAGLKNLELTNNAAERAIRQGVLYRKRSFGVDSGSGGKFLERVMTTVGTLRKQERNLMEFVFDAVGAFLSGELGPSLLPLQQTP